jgi:hypothetical protein
MNYINNEQNTILAESTSTHDRKNVEHAVTKAKLSNQASHRTNKSATKSLNQFYDLLDEATPNYVLGYN